MNLMSNLYKSQFFVLLAISATLTMQYELIMLDRGVALTISLIVFSLGQISNISMILLFSRYADKAKNKNLLIQICLIIRTVVVGIMFFTNNPFIFSGLYLIFMVASAGNILFEGLVAQWSFDNNLKFPRIRFFGSVGFAAAGFIATFIFEQTGVLNNLVLLIFVMNLYSTIVAFIAPVDTKPPKKDEQTSIKIPNIYRFMLFLVAFILAFPNVFSVVLNNHFREAFYLSVEDAIFYASLSVFFGAFVAEFFAFFSVDRLIKKIKPKNVISLGIGLSLARWILSLISVNEMMFAIIFLIHGFGFVFVYIGALGYIKDKVGNQHTSKLLMEFVVMVGVLGLVMIQIANVVLNFANSNFLIGIFVALNAVIALVFYLVFYVKYKEA